MLKLNTMKVTLTFLLLFFIIFSTQAASLVEEEAKAYREKGYRLQTMGDLEGALMYYQKAAQMAPYFAEVQNDLGVIYEATGDLDKAESLYKKTLELDPKYLPAYTNLAFLYEKKGDIKQATIYWKKRYIAGEEGDYWKEVAKQHLLKLGTYPEVKKEMLEEKAARLSRELIYQREQEKLKAIEEAKLHFKVGNQAFVEGDYEIAIKEFRTVLSLNSPDRELTEKARKLYKDAERLYLRERVLVDTKSALEYIESNEYLSAGEKLKSALTSIFRITQ